MTNSTRITPSKIQTMFIRALVPSFRPVAGTECMSYRSDHPEGPEKSVEELHHPQSPLPAWVRMMPMAVDPPET